jgi:hypothetical protein
MAQLANRYPPATTASTLRAEILGAVFATTTAKC